MKLPLLVSALLLSVGADPKATTEITKEGEKNDEATMLNDATEGTTKTTTETTTVTTTGTTTGTTTVTTSLIPDFTHTRTLEMHCSKNHFGKTFTFEGFVYHCGDNVGVPPQAIGCVSVMPLEYTYTRFLPFDRSVNISGITETCEFVGSRQATITINHSKQEKIDYEQMFSKSTVFGDLCYFNGREMKIGDAVRIGKVTIVCLKNGDKHELRFIGCYDKWLYQDVTVKEPEWVTVATCDNFKAEDTLSFEYYTYGIYPSSNPANETFDQSLLENEVFNITKNKKKRSEPSSYTNSSQLLSGPFPKNCCIAREGKTFSINGIVFNCKLRGAYPPEAIGCIPFIPLENTYNSILPFDRNVTTGGIYQRCDLMPNRTATINFNYSQTDSIDFPRVVQQNRTLADSCYFNGREHPRGAAVRIGKVTIACVKNEHNMHELRFIGCYDEEYYPDARMYDPKSVTVANCEKPGGGIDTDGPFSFTFYSL